MKTKAENLRLFIEARELRDTIRSTLHIKANNSSQGLIISLSTEGIGSKKTHNKNIKATR